MLWKVPPYFEGETIYILGGGPSLNSVPVDKLKGRAVISINRGFKIAGWAPIHYINDCNPIRWYKEQISRLAQRRIVATICRYCRDHPDIRYLRCSGTEGVETERRDSVRTTHAGQGAINLAVLLGGLNPKTKIVLFAFDMHAPGGRNHWHSGYPEKITPNYKRWTHPRPTGDAKRPDRPPIYETVKQSVDKLGIEIVNATPGSALKTFPIVDPKSVI